MNSSFYWIGFESRYLQIGPNSVSLSKEHAPVVPKVAQSWMEEEEGLFINFLYNIIHAKVHKKQQNCAIIVWLIDN